MTDWLMNLYKALFFLAQQLVSCKDRNQIRVLVLRGHIFLIDQNSDSKTTYMLWQNAELNLTNCLKSCCITQII